MSQPIGAELLDQSARAKLLSIVQRHGDVEVANRLKVGRQAVARLAAGLPCRRGTVALAAMGLESLELELDGPSGRAVA